MNPIQYRIQTYQDSYGDCRWHFVIKKYMRVIFKRSQREGWRWMGFIDIKHYPSLGFETRAEAMAYAQGVKGMIP